MFEVMIPLQQSSRRAREREAEYMLMAAEARREDARARATGELGIAWSMYALATAVMIRDRRIGLWSYASGSVSATELRRSFQLTARQTTTRQYYSPSKALPRA